MVADRGTVSPELDLFERGPFTAHLRQLKLTGRSPRPVLARALIAAFLAWAPMVVLAIVQGVALADHPRESMLLDIRVHVVFLFALPVMILTETSVLRRLAANAAHFWNSGLVPSERRADFDAAVSSARRLLTSRWSALFMLLAAVGLVWLARGWAAPMEAGSSWRAPASLGGEPSLALQWQRWVSLPLFFGALLAWVLRFVVWGRFLLAMTRLDLRLIPSDPDGRGGVGFLTTSLPPCGLLGFALSSALAGGMMDRIVHDGASPLSWKWVPVVPVTLILLLSVTPLLVFYPLMWLSWRRGLLAYNRLTLAVGQQFERAWLKAPAGESPDSLQVNDFSATTDLFSITTNVYRMNLIPFDLVSLVAVIVPTLLPFVPVALTVVPLLELLQAVTRFLI